MADIPPSQIRNTALERKKVVTLLSDHFCGQCNAYRFFFFIDPSKQESLSKTNWLNTYLLMCVEDDILSKLHSYNSKDLISFKFSNLEDLVSPQKEMKKKRIFFRHRNIKFENLPFFIKCYNFVNGGEFNLEKPFFLEVLVYINNHS